MNDDKKIKVEVTIPGVSEFADVSAKSVDLAIDATKTFLKLVCGPPLEQIGLFIGDHIKFWRITNIINFNNKIEKILPKNFEQSNLRLNTKLAFDILESVSKEDDDNMQNLWAYLLKNALSESGADDSMFPYLLILKELNKPQALLLKYMVERFKDNKKILSIAEVSSAMNLTDESLIQMQIRHLLKLGIITSSLMVTGYQPIKQIFPSLIGLDFFEKISD